MAKVRSNLVIHGLSGMLGKQLVVRAQKGGSFVVAAAPRRGANVPISDAVKQQRERFRQALLYAKGAKAREEYKEAAKARGLSPANVAVADFMHPPEIRAIDLSRYHGAPEQTIGITAVDDVKVSAVAVRITTEDGTVVEEGPAVVSANDTSLWTYTTTSTAPRSAIKVVVDVADLAGHVTEKAEAFAFA